MKEKSERSKTVQLTPEYKKKLDRLANELSLEFDERVPINSIIYFMIDNYLDFIADKMRKKHHGG